MASPKISLPRPLNFWFQDHKSVERLREILSDPVFRTACATLAASAQPAHSATRNLSPEQRSASFDWLAGYSDFVRDLEKLTQIPVQGTPLLEEWNHLATTL